MLLRVRGDPGTRVAIEEHPPTERGSSPRRVGMQ